MGKFGDWPNGITFDGSHRSLGIAQILRENQLEKLADRKITLVVMGLVEADRERFKGMFEEKGIVVPSNF